MISEKITFNQAAKRYKLDSGVHYVRPARKNCHYSRGAWYLLDKRGSVVAIVDSTRSSLWGSKLAYYFNEIGGGNAA